MQEKDLRNQGIITPNMFKLVILIEAQQDWLKFEQKWPKFLKAAEQMPGLVRESTSPVHNRLHGSLDISMIHELYFEDRSALKNAMSSQEGQLAGQILQAISDGKVTLLFADHLEDELANIKALQSPPKEGPPGDRA